MFVVAVRTRRKGRLSISMAIPVLGEHWLTRRHGGIRWDMQCDAVGPSSGCIRELVPIEAFGLMSLALYVRLNIELYYLGGMKTWILL